MKGPLRFVISAVSLLLAALWLLQPPALVTPGGTQDGSVYVSQTMRAARLAAALADTSRVKTYMTIYREQTGHYPRDNAELGIGPPDSFNDGALRALRVDDSGRIVASLGGVFPRDAQLVYTPRTTGNLNGLTLWRCQIFNVPLEVAAYVSGCEVADRIDLAKNEKKAKRTADHPPRVPPPEALRKAHLSRELERAIDGGDQRRVQELLERGADYRGGPMVTATRRGQTEFLSWFLDAGADPDTPDLFDVTPLLAAIPSDAPPGEQAPAIVALLLQHGADPNQRDERGDTPLLRLISSSKNAKDATRQRLSSIAGLLLDNGADPRQPDPDGHDALDRAVELGAAALTALLLDRIGADKLPENRRTALLDSALHHDDAELLATLSRHGMRIEEASLADRYSRFLRLSARNQYRPASPPGHIGASVSRRASTLDEIAANDTHAALLEHDWERLIELLRQGRPMPRRVRANADDPGTAVFTYLFQYAGTDITKRVLEAISDLERYRNDHGESPLIEALNNGYSELIVPMLRAGADPNARDAHGRGALRLALALRDREAARALIAAGGLPRSPEALQQLTEQAWDAGLDEIAEDLDEAWHHAASSRHQALLEMLIAEPARHLWAEHCAPQRGAWFALARDHGHARLLTANGRAIQPLPAFEQPIALHEDPRVAWLGEDQLRLRATADQPARIYRRCGPPPSVP